MLYMFPLPFYKPRSAIALPNPNFPIQDGMTSHLLAAARLVAGHLVEVTCHGYQTRSSALWTKRVRQR